MADSRTVHDEVIRVGFDDAQAQQQLARLQAAADALVKSVLAVPVGIGAGGPGAGGGGATMASGNMPTPSGGGGGGAPGATPSGGATVSSGSAVPPVASDTGGGGAATKPSCDDSAAGGGSAPRTQPSGGRARDAWKRFDAAGATAISNIGTAVQRGGVEGGIQGMTRIAAAAAGGGMLGSAIQAAGSLTGLEMLANNSQARAQLDRVMLLPSLAGLTPDFELPEWRQRVNAYGIPLEPGANVMVRHNGVEAYMETAAHQYGLSQEAAAAMAGQYVRGAGGNVEGRGSRFLDLSLAGVDPGTTGALDRAWIVNGATGNAQTTERLAAVGQQGFGLRAGLNDWLAKIAGHFDTLLNRGMKVDGDQWEELLDSASRDDVLKGLGDRAPGVVNAFASAPASAKSRLLAPFQGVMESMTLAEAIGSSDNYFEAIGKLEEMGPQGAIDAVRKGLPEDAATAALNAQAPQLRIAEARRFAQGLERAPDGDAYKLDKGDPKLLERAIAEVDKSFWDKFENVQTPEQRRLQIEATKETDALKGDIGKGILSVLQDISENIKETNDLIIESREWDPIPPFGGP